MHIHFDPLFDVTRTPACRDEYVLISTRRQRFNDLNIVRNRKDSVAFCGNQKPSNVTSPANEMWIRFKSKSGGRRGFRVWYGAEGELEPRTHYTVEPRFNEVLRDKGNLHFTMYTLFTFPTFTNYIYICYMFRNFWIHFFSHILH